MYGAGTTAACRLQRRYNRWETLQDVTRVFEHHNHCSGPRTAVCDQGTPLHMDCY